jgi:hypothetical protein
MHVFTALEYASHKEEEEKSTTAQKSDVAALSLHQ